MGKLAKKIAAIIRGAYFPLINKLKEGLCGHGIAVVVFSKDRPLQLHGLLDSLRSNCQDLGHVFVIYRATNKAYKKAYHQAALLIQSPTFHMLNELHFRTDVLTVIGATNAERVLFFVDDIVVIRPFLLSQTMEFDPRETVLSLRLGVGIDYCYTQQKKQSPPELTKFENTASDDRYYWKWEKGVLEWGYPLSVDGHIFSTREIYSLAKNTSFCSPNSFEAGLQKYNPEFSKRMGVCWDTPRLVNIACNRVQHEFTNRSGSQSPETLLRAWNDGYRLDWRSLQDLESRSPHIEMELPLVKTGREI